MTDREKVIEQLESMRDYHRSAGNNITADIASDALVLLKKQEQTINELEEKLRLLEYGDQDTLQSGMMPAT